MKTEILDIFKIAQKIASIAKNETKKSLSTEIVKLTLFLQIGEPVYVTYNEKEKLVYINMSKIETMCELVTGYKPILIIEKSKELNKYKITYI